MAVDLTEEYVDETFAQLLHISAELHATTLRQVLDGDGTASALYLAGDKVDVDGAFTAGTIVSDAGISGTAITGTSFVIGANTLTTTEWAFLDGLDQALKQADSPTFVDLTFKRLFGGSEHIISTSETVAASVTEIITEIVTNGDQDLDKVSLANGTADGQIKIFLINQGHALDLLWIVIPNLKGGSHIIFAAPPEGKGCILIWDNSLTNWVMIGTNGGVLGQI